MVTRAAQRGKAPVFHPGRLGRGIDYRLSTYISMAGVFPHCPLSGLLSGAPPGVAPGISHSPDTTFTTSHSSVPRSSRRQNWREERSHLQIVFLRKEKKTIMEPRLDEKAFSELIMNVWPTTRDGRLGLYLADQNMTLSKARRQKVGLYILILIEI